MMQCHKWWRISNKNILGRCINRMACRGTFSQKALICRLYLASVTVSNIPTYTAMLWGHPVSPTCAASVYPMPSCCSCWGIPSPAAWRKSHIREEDLFTPVHPPMTPLQYSPPVKHFSRSPQREMQQVAKFTAQCVCQASKWRAGMSNISHVRLQYSCLVTRLHSCTRTTSGMSGLEFSGGVSPVWSVCSLESWSEGRHQRPHVVVGDNRRSKGLTKPCGNSLLWPSEVENKLCVYLL